MNRGPMRVRSMVTILLLLGGIHAVAAQEQKPKAPTPEDAVRAAEYARAQALLKADTTALGQLVATEFIEISRLGQVRTRTDNLQDIASGALKLVTVRYDSLAVRLYGDVAVLQGIADNTGSIHGMPFGGK